MSKPLINSVAEAFTHLGIDPQTSFDLSTIPEQFREPLMAVFKIMVVQEAIANGQEFDWENWDERKWSLWFEMGSASGVGFSSYGYDYGSAYSDVGSRLSYPTKEDAQHVASVPEFVELYKAFFHKKPKQ